MIMNATSHESKLSRVPALKQKQKRELKTDRLLQKKALKQQKQKQMKQTLQQYLQQNVMKAEQKQKQEEEIRALYEKQNMQKQCMKEKLQTCRREELEARRRI